MESVAISGILNFEAISNVNPFYVPVSKKYGSRLSLEQVCDQEHEKDYTG